jgi:hypothetical protein
MAGAPWRAHEDDAERAVRAGLELIAAVTALKANKPTPSCSTTPAAVFRHGPTLPAIE